MEALDLIVLGRRLAKIGENALRGKQGPGAPTGQSLVLRDVFANPNSSITDITDRTGLPQSYVSESVARLRKQGILQTHVDPSDRRRTLARISARHARTIARKAATSVDQALSEIFDDPYAPATLETLAKRLRPSAAGPIVAQIEDTRKRA